MVNYLSTYELGKALTVLKKVTRVDYLAYYP